MIATECRAMMGRWLCFRSLPGIDSPYYLDYVLRCVPPPFGFIKFLDQQAAESRILWHKHICDNMFGPERTPTSAMSECNQSRFEFAAHFSRQVVARFDGGTITTDRGGLLLRETDRRLNLLPRLAECFLDARNRVFVEHSVEQLVSQRVYGLALGYEDLNDHEQLRQDPLLRVLAGKADVEDSPLAGNRRKSSWIWMSPILRCMESRRVDFSTATMTAIAICRCISSAETRFCVRACGNPTATPRRAVWRRSNGSWGRSARPGRRCGSFYGGTRASAAMS